MSFQEHVVYVDRLGVHDPMTNTLLSRTVFETGHGPREAGHSRSAACGDLDPFFTESESIVVDKFSDDDGNRLEGFVRMNDRNPSPGEYRNIEDVYPDEDDIPLASDSTEGAPDRPIEGRHSYGYGGDLYISGAESFGTFPMCCVRYYWQASVVAYFNPAGSFINREIDLADELYRHEVVHHRIARRVASFVSAGHGKLEGQQLEMWGSKACCDDSFTSAALQARGKARSAAFDALEAARADAYGLAGVASSAFDQQTYGVGNDSRHTFDQVSGFWNSRLDSGSFYPRSYRSHTQYMSVP